MRIHQKLAVAGVCLLLAGGSLAQAPAAPTQPTPSTETQEAAPQAPAAPADAAATPEAPRQKTAEEILNEEKKQKMLGIVPVYGMTNYSYAPPLTAGQKFNLMARSYGTIFPYLSAGIQAGLSQAFNSFEGYGQGASGYGKRFGSALADGGTSAFFSNFFYPVIFKQDPRYFRMGEQYSTKRRILSVMKQEFVTKKDSPDRHRTFSYSNVLGSLTAGSISNAYYPQEERGFGLTMSRAGVSLGWGMVGNCILEFWPDISRGLMHKQKNPNPVPIK